MKRTLACLAAVAVAFATQSAHAKSADPIGDLLSKTVQSSPATSLKLKATLYHVGAKGVGNRDSLGCTVSPMRTLAVDPRFLPRRSIVFIKETVGLPMPGGGKHDGLWYASDTGGKIKGSRVDLFTGHGAASMKAFFKRGLNVAVLNASRVGSFKGCPPR
jgi:3D (Asp-Asp-Asp) domain-containing protein